MSKKICAWIHLHRTPIIGIGATVLCLFLLVLIIDFVVMPLYTHLGEEEELPDVTEMSFQQAEEILDEEGFRIVFDGMKFDETYPESTVVFQNPSPYSRVKKGRRIYVRLSAGERMIAVPSVVGMSERDAEFALRQTELSLGEVFYEYHNYHLAGVVFEQSLDFLTEVEAGTPVDITVSIGNLPSNFIVPDVAGKSLDAATRLIRQAGLNVGQVRYEVRANLVPETVLRQSHEPGSDVPQSASIDLIVSQLEEPS